VPARGSQKCLSCEISSHYPHIFELLSLISSLGTVHQEIWECWERISILFFCEGLQRIYYSEGREEFYLCFFLNRDKIFF